MATPSTAPLITPERVPREPRVVLQRELLDGAASPLPLRSIFDPISDLTTAGATDDSEAIGERIVLTGQVFDAQGRPAADALVELWQANAAGRYRLTEDDHRAPIDPNFNGLGRAFTDTAGWYRFRTIKPGPYPVPGNRWRPAHLHFSVVGPRWTDRLITQMYFPGDPLHAQDVTDLLAVPAHLRHALIAKYAPEFTEAEFALGYRFDVVCDGPATSREASKAMWSDDDGMIPITPLQSPGPYVRASLGRSGLEVLAPFAAGPQILVSGSVRDEHGRPVPAMIEIRHGRRWGRAVTDAADRFSFETTLPDGEPSYVDLIVFARGLPYHLMTRLYFGNAKRGNDQALDHVPEARRASLIAELSGRDCQHDIRLRGERETVFFEVAEPALERNLREIRAASVPIALEPPTVYRP